MKNNMVCDIETGVCGIAEENEMELIDLNILNEKIDLYYVTDPICSYCWALEPVIRHFKAVYGHYFNFHIIMGGLLESWDGFSDPANGINTPSDVAAHWRELGVTSRMPIDGTLWLNNPIQSSYPASRVFKVIQEENNELAGVFLRKSREAVFIMNQNISEDHVLIDIVNSLGLDGEEIITESTLPKSQKLLEEDFTLAAKLGVRGFPTIIMVNKENKGVKIVGARPFESYVDGLKQALTEKHELKPNKQPELSMHLKDNTKLFSIEIEEMYGLKKNEVREFVENNLLLWEYEFKEFLGEVYVQLKK